MILTLIKGHKHYGSSKTLIICIIRDTEDRRSYDNRIRIIIFLNIIYPTINESHGLLCICNVNVLDNIHIFLRKLKKSFLIMLT